jgi:uncharacterized protein YndB with AHSA1/START domain
VTKTPASRKTVPSVEGLLGALGSADGSGVMRMEDRIDTGVEEVWSAVTGPARLARWLGEVEGDLRLGGEFRAHPFAGGWEGTGSIEVCEPAHGLLVRVWDATSRDEGSVEVVEPAYRELAPGGWGLEGIIPSG